MLLTSLFAFSSFATEFITGSLNLNLSGSYITPWECLTMRYNPDSFFSAGARASTDASVSNNQHGVVYTYILGDNGEEAYSETEFFEGTTSINSGKATASGSRYGTLVIHKVQMIATSVDVVYECTVN